MTSESPLLLNKHFAHPAVFQPENLLRETRRQKSLPAGSIPAVCVLDPDGDIVAHLMKNHQAAVEMEAASLYAFAQAKQKPVVCFAHITNRMGVNEGVFQKGEADGTVASLRLIEAVTQVWLCIAHSTGPVKEQRWMTPCGT